MVFEDAHVLAFLDVQPRAPGHTLVIPKVHAATLVELPDAEVAPLFAVVKHVDRILLDKLAPDGMTIGINQGEVSGQAVPHLHVHLLPRFVGDKGSSIHTIVNNPARNSLQEMVEKLTG